jgi:hypothetical protein
MIWEMCHVKGGGVRAIILTLVCLLKQRIISFWNCNVFWKMIICKSKSNLLELTTNWNYLWKKNNMYFSLQQYIRLRNYFVFTNGFNFLGLNQCWVIFIFLLKLTNSSFYMMLWEPNWFFTIYIYIYILGLVRISQTIKLIFFSNSVDF